MEAEKLTLRPMCPTDQGQILEILTSPVVNKTYMLPDYERSEDAIPLFQRLAELSQNQNRFVRCIALGETAIGFLNDVEIRGGTIELGYAKVECGAFEENKASQRVMEKAGMVKIEKTEQIEYRGKIHNCVYYEIRNRKGD